MCGLLALAMLPFASSGSQDFPGRDMKPPAKLQCEPVRIGALGTWAPMYERVGNAYRGQYVDYVENMLGELGPGHSWISWQPNERLLRRMRDNEVDLVIAAYQWGARDARFHNAGTVFRRKVGLVYRTGYAPPVNGEVSVLSFRSFRQTNFLGELREQGAEVLELEEYSRALELVAEGRFNYIYADVDSLLLEATRLGFSESEFGVHPDHMITKDVVMYLRPGNYCPGLGEALQRWVSERPYSGAMK